MTDVTYDASTLTLRIRFTDGDWYSYSSVPPPVADALLAADSPGHFFQSNIRNRYPYRREY